MSQASWGPLSESTVEALTAAGWYPGRRVDPKVLEGWAQLLRAFVINEPARTILSEFGGIRVHQEGSGVERGRAPFWIDPERAEGEDDRFERFLASSGELFPIGELWGGYALLAVNAEGRVYAVMDDLYLIGNDFGEALDRLVKGMSALNVWSD